MQHDCNYCGQTFCGSCTVKVKRAVLGATCMQAKISSPDIIDLICPLYSSCSFRGISESVFRLQKQTRWAKARPKFNSCIVIIFSSFFFRKKKKHVYFSKNIIGQINLVAMAIIFEFCPSFLRADGTGPSILVPTGSFFSLRRMMWWWSYRGNLLLICLLLIMSALWTLPRWAILMMSPNFPSLLFLGSLIQ